LVEADQSTSEGGKGEMDVLTTLIADCKAAEAVEPSQCALHHPAISSQALADVYPAAGDPRCDGPLAALRAAPPMIVGFMDLLRKDGEPLMKQEDLHAPDTVYERVSG
jgi:hypothetical protein